MFFSYFTSVHLSWLYVLYDVSTYKILLFLRLITRALTTVKLLCLSSSYYYYYYYLRELLTQRKQKLRWWGGLTTLVLMWGIGCTLNFYPRLLKSKNVCWVAWEIRVTQLTFWLYISSCFHLEITRNHLKIDKIQEGALPYGDLIYTVPPKWTYIFLHLKTLLKQSNSHHTIYPSVYVSLLNNWPHDLMTASRGSRTSAISIPNTVFSQYCIPYQDFDESSSPE